LTSRLLRLANSALYGFPSQIGTLEEAVQLIGLRQIQDLVLATCVIRVFDQIPIGMVDVPAFWEHSIACGMASALLAQAQHDPAPERFFVGGLLHDVGWLVLFLKAPRESREILDRSESSGRLTTYIEHEVLGFDHAMLGEALISSWQLPPSLREMVGCHHNPTRSRIAFMDATIVHCADFITTALDFGHSGERWVPPLVIPDACRRPVIEVEWLPSIIDELEVKCEQLLPILTSHDYD